MNKHKVVITGDQVTFMGSEEFEFATAEAAADYGYRFSKEYPMVTIHRYVNDTLVSAYNSRMGWW